MARIIRPERTTVFAFGEGEDERVVLKHLRASFAKGLTEVRVDYAGGKDPNFIVDKAIRVRGTNVYNHSLILADNDRAWSGALTTRATTHHFEVIKSRQTLECLMLSILDASRDYSTLQSEESKRVFRERHLRHGRALDSRDCLRLFPPQLLQREMGRIAELARLIEIVQGNF
ncbi:MAG: hypothetical protein Athens041674_455 [Parcubacteria group bacterium Athens0416_74]|nr:MAG: hypothetical protein Athens041674_455 [Parcubacteria group bacterium Athens0416_74]